MIASFFQNLDSHRVEYLLISGQEGEVFLDVMGKPPRVGSFESALVSAKWIDTEWGRLHTIGIKDLVELKKTQRLGDYPIISKLALAWFDQPECAAVAADSRWVLANIFALAELLLFFEARPGAAACLPGDVPAALKEFAGQHLATGDAPEQVEESVSAWMQQRMAAFQQADRRYWRDIIAELRKLRAQGRGEQDRHHQAPGRIELRAHRTGVSAKGYEGDWPPILR